MARHAYAASGKSLSALTVPRCCTISYSIDAAAAARKRLFATSIASARFIDADPFAAALAGSDEGRAGAAEAI